MTDEEQDQFWSDQSYREQVRKEVARKLAEREVRAIARDNRAAALFIAVMIAGIIGLTAFGMFVVWLLRMLRG